MAFKHAQFISYGDDNPCEETKQFIEQSGIILNIRDIRDIIDFGVCRFQGHH